MRKMRNLHQTPALAGRHWNLNEVNKKGKGSQAFEFISILMVPGRGHTIVSEVSDFTQEY